MTPPTDTVTPERLAKLKDKYSRFTSVPRIGSQTAFELIDAIPVLIAHIERVEADKGKIAKCFTSCVKKCVGIEAQRDRALAKLKELGESLRKMEKEYRAEQILNLDGGHIYAANYVGGFAMGCLRGAQAAEAAHKELMT